MKLNHDEFAALLARALDIDESEASGTLQAWVDAVAIETDENGSCHVAGLGTFRKGDDGYLDFQPDEVLSLEVNHKFAGMSPIEVSPSKSVSDDPSEEEAPGLATKATGEEPEDETDPFGISDQPAEEQLPGSEMDSDADEEPEEELEFEAGAEGDRKRDQATSAPDEDQEPVEETESGPQESDAGLEDERLSGHAYGADTAPEEGPEEQPATDRESEPEPAFSEQQEEDPADAHSPPVLPKISLSQRVKPGGGASKNRRRDRKEILVWLVPVAAILIAALLLFFHFDGQRLDQRNLSGQEVVQEQVPVPVPDDRREDDRAVQEIVPTPDAVEDEATPPDRDPAPGPAGNAGPGPADEMTRDSALPYGLRGPEDEVLIGAYTIVVHSLRNERKSEIEKQRLENQGFKATRWAAVLPNGNTSYRVGIGQFKSVSDAERAVEELPEPFRSNNFIIRIR